MRSENFYQYFFQTNKINRTKIKIKFVRIKNKFIFVPVNVKQLKFGQNGKLHAICKRFAYFFKRLEKNF